MPAERRYRDHEIAAIFERAAEDQEEARYRAEADEGLTLAELQEVGASVGIAPEFVANAARAVDRAGKAAPRQTLLGLPIGVARTVVLPGPFSDADWARLVVDLRDTFRARGRIRQDGALRQWTNGNLRVTVEPVEGGHRLRMRTVKGRAQSGLVSGATLLAVGLVFLFVALLAGGPGGLPWLPGLLASIGSGIFFSNAVRLPQWAQTRERQMEEVAARASDRAAAPLQPSALAEPAPRLDLDALPDALPDTEEDAAPPARRRTR